MKRSLIGFSAMLLVFCSSLAQASLIKVADDIYYLEGTNTMWYAKSITDGDPYYKWFVAVNDWANNLVFGGYSDWKLPSVSTSSGTPSGTSGDLGPLYAELMNNTSNPSTGDYTPFLGLSESIHNLYTDSGSPNGVWGYDFKLGNYSEINTSWANTGWSGIAVRYGSPDIPPTATPEPATMLLMGVGAAGAAFMRRRKASRAA